MPNTESKTEEKGQFKRAVAYFNSGVVSTLPVEDMTGKTTEVLKWLLDRYKMHFRSASSKVPCRIVLTFNNEIEEEED